MQVARRAEPSDVNPPYPVGRAGSRSQCSAHRSRSSVAQARSPGAPTWLSEAGCAEQMTKSSFAHMNVHYAVSNAARAEG